MPFHPSASPKVWYPLCYTKWIYPISKTCIKSLHSPQLLSGSSRQKKKHKQSSTLIMSASCSTSTQFQTNKQKTKIPSSRVYSSIPRSWVQITLLQRIRKRDKYEACSKTPNCCLWWMSIIYKMIFLHPQNIMAQGIHSDTRYPEGWNVRIKPKGRPRMMNIKFCISVSNIHGTQWQNVSCSWFRSSTQMSLVFNGLMTSLME